MANVFIIHGVAGHPGENWFPWLRRELESSGCRVFVPQFPTPENQTLDSWLEVLAGFGEFLDKDSIVVGHSLGVAFLLNVLERRKAKAAFLVAGFVGKAGNKFDPIMKTFSQRKFDWKAIKRNCRHFEVFHSDNDPYLPIERGKEVADRLGVKLTVVKGAGHFNEKSGYTTFPLLLESIKRIL